MLKRSDDGRFFLDEFDFQLENQSGEKLIFNLEIDCRFFFCFFFILYYVVFILVDREVFWFLFVFCKNVLFFVGYGMVVQCCGRGF